MAEYRGIGHEVVEQISREKNEPEWMRRFRLRCLRIFERLEDPKWGPNLDALSLNDLTLYLGRDGDVADDWAAVPAEIRESFERLGIPEAEREGLAGVAAQYDSENVYHKIRREVAGEGVVYLGMEEALADERFSEMLREYFMKLVKPSEHRYAALHGAVWSGGSFVYVPKGQKVSMPLQAYYRFNAAGAGQFEHTLIIVDEEAELEFIEGCSAPRYSQANLHAGCVEIFVGRRAKVHYYTVENWSKNMYNLNTKRATVAKGGQMEWVTGSFGSKISMLYPMTILAEAGASLDYLGLSLAGRGQEIDGGVKVEFLAPDCSAHMQTKSIAKDGGVNNFRSYVKVSEAALRATSFLDCESLILDAKSRSDAFPFYDVRCGSVEVSHEAKMGKISPEKLEFLAARGIGEKKARALVVRGFSETVSRELPVEYAVEMNRLIRMELEG